ncbi:uncharacterized protein LTR77_000100 [Saxophila tyrrhenica]|uniref:Carboxylic ester hydrolase n=1 Tax=Saxophila tyrrhenica TaxID=1690608 RepID=A0AAV9PLR6_9PEZI|nr:hypothetical protein LTR77_000100 [Saxophila tyrrhenica]
MAPELPRGAGGAWMTGEQFGSPFHWNFAFNRTMPTCNGTASNDIYAIGNLDDTRSLLVKWPADNYAPLKDRIRGCAGHCTAKILAPALAPLACTSHELPVDYTKAPSFQKSHANIAASPLAQEQFFVSVGLGVDQTETVNVVTGYSTTEDRKGTLRYTACTLVSAVGEYTVDVYGDLAHLYDPGKPKIIALANNTVVYDEIDSNSGGYRSTLAQVVARADDEWNNYRAVYHDGVTDNLITTYAGAAMDQFYIDRPTTCASYRDPGPSVRRSLNSFMVWSGASAAASQNATFAAYLEARMDEGWAFDTTVVGAVAGKQAVFQTDYLYFLAAALVEIVCIAFVAPTYWGWWRIGRPVSFSPLEMAKAFESPMLANCNSNTTGRDLAKAVGGHRVRYGVGMGLHGESKIAFGDTG